MGGHEARINDALKQLGEEFRLGMVQLAEYRLRRKALIETWGERDVTTAPRSLRGSNTATGPAPRGRMPLPAAKAPPPKRSAVPIAIAAIAILALGGGGWFFLSKTAKPPRGAVALPAAAPLSPQAATVCKSADEFVTRNVWDGASIQAFLAQWQALSPADRARVAEEPAMRTLRYKLDQNIQAEMQLITPDTKPEDRAQLDLLQDFSRSLAGETR